jgi:hypothetical protein
MEKKPNFFDQLEKTIYSYPKYFGILESIEFVVFLLIVYKYNPFNISTKYPVYTQFAVLITGFIYVILFFFVKYNLIEKSSLFNLGLPNPTEKDFIKRIASILFVLIAFVLITALLFQLFRNTSFLFLLFKYSIHILLIIGIVSILYLLTNKLFSKLLEAVNIGKQDSGTAINFLKLIKNFVLFLPCLLISFVEYVQYQFNITTKPIWTLLFIEFLLVSLWFLIPQFIHYYYTTTNQGTVLLKDPLYLNKEHTLGDFENIHLDNIKKNKNTKFNYNYSISAWFTLNPQPTNTRAAYTKYTNILNYGKKPAIQFNSKKNSLLINTLVGRDTTDNNINMALAADTEADPNKKRMTTDTDASANTDVGDDANIIEIYETTSINFQKWNNVVINYDGGTMDVFLNGILVASKKNVAPYMTYETITVGEKKGIEGGICNVVYYDHTLPNRTIKTVYNYLKNKEIPLF